ncbi:MAG: right-handed parallel beta-helix repeat-containing protein, partial [Candidatus Poribacteria bacterium]
MLIALLMCLIVGVASATETVVDTRSPVADDRNPGTRDLPFRTIQHAADVARAGDTVTVASGVYREAVNLRHSGEPGRLITFVGEPGAVITGADVIREWERVPGDLPIYRAPWAHRFIINHTPDGVPIEHHPDDAPVWRRAEQVIVEGKQLAPVGSLRDLREIAGEMRTFAEARRIPVAADPSTWAGAFYADTDAGTLYVLLAAGADPTDADTAVEASARGLLFGTNPWMNPEGVEDVHVSGFTFRYGATFPQRAAVWLHGRNNVLEGCRVEEMSGGGVSVSGAMRDCVIRDNGHVGGGAGGDGFANENCLWTGNSWKPINRQWDAGGYKITK